MSVLSQALDLKVAEVQAQRTFDSNRTAGSKRQESENTNSRAKINELVSRECQSGCINGELVDGEKIVEEAKGRLRKDWINLRARRMVAREPNSRSFERTRRSLRRSLRSAGLVGQGSPTLLRNPRGTGLFPAANRRFWDSCEHGTGSYHSLDCNLPAILWIDVRRRRARAALRLAFDPDYSMQRRKERGFQEQSIRRSRWPIQHDTRRIRFADIGRCLRR